MYQGKGSGPDVISAYRRRLGRAQKLQFLVWGIAALVVVGAGVLLFFLFRPDDPSLAVSITDTPDTAETQPVQEVEATTPPPPPSQTPSWTNTPAATLLPTEPSVITHTVQEGETLAGIAGTFGVDLSALMSANPLVTPEFINVGDELTIPGSAGIEASATAPAAVGASTTTPAAAPGSMIEHLVVAGDTLAAIAANYGVSMDAIVQENGLASADQIQEGQTLRIPAAGSAATPQAVDAATPTAGITLTPTP